MSSTAPHSTSGQSNGSSGLLAFFQYHGFWAPGVRLFRHLRFRVKAVLISAVLVLPALVLGQAYLRMLQDDLEFARQEHEGVVAMQKFVPVLYAVLETRNATRAMLGDYDAAKDYAAARSRVDAAMSAFDAHLKASGDPMDLLKPFGEMQAAWAATGKTKNGVDDQGRTVFGPVTEASLKVLQGLSDNSKLVLDPDVDSLYMINALFLTMPRTAEDLGQIWGWGTYGVAKGGLDNPEQYKKVAVWNARTGGGVDDARAFFDRAFTANEAARSAVNLKGFDEVIKFQKSADPTALIKAAMEPAEVYEAGHKALAAYFTVFDSALPVLDGIIGQRAERLTLARNIKLSLVVGCLLLGAYLFVSFAKVMDGGMREVARHLDTMADGDLTQSPRPWGKDEAAYLMRALARMQESMRQIVNDVRRASDGIVTASSEIATGSMDLSGRTEQTASELEQTAASLEEINATLGNTTSNTHDASGLAAENAQAAERGGAVIGQAMTTMQQISQASVRIGDIIGVIDGIAFQTNILALNAAVEAARAGEQGRGFAVVAGEVRTLASRSAEAAREIKRLITDTVEKVQQGSQVVAQAGQEMQTLVRGAQSINTVLGEIRVAADQQASGVRQVGEAVNQLDQMTQQNAALVEQTAAASESLKEQAYERFRVDTTAV